MEWRMDDAAPGMDRRVLLLNTWLPASNFPIGEWNTSCIPGRCEDLLLTILGGNAWAMDNGEGLLVPASRETGPDSY